jgi:hypothetical protein
MQRMPVDATTEIERLAPFGRRPPGSDAERRAARHLEQRLQALGREAEAEPISIHPNYPLAHVLHALLAVVGSVLSVTVPIAGAALVLIAAVSAFGDLSGSFPAIRRLTGRRASQNVTSREGGRKPGLLILTAHYDTGRGGVFSRRPGTRRGPFELFFWAIFAILVCTVLRVVGLEGTPLTIVQFVPTVILIASVPLLADAGLSAAVPAATDNAAGVATVLRLAERYGGRLEHFDVWVVLPGATEALLLGMRAWIRRHRRELDPERTVFLDLDLAGGGGVRWIPKEGLVVAMRYHPELVRLCEDDGEGAPLVSRGASDALMARAAGFPALPIVAPAPADAPPAGDPDELERAYGFCCRLVERLDREVGPQLAR